MEYKKHNDMAENVKYTMLITRQMHRRTDRRPQVPVRCISALRHTKRAHHFVSTSLFNNTSVVTELSNGRFNNQMDIFRHRTCSGPTSYGLCYATGNRLGLLWYYRKAFRVQMRMPKKWPVSNYALPYCKILM